MGTQFIRRITTEPMRLGDLDIPAGEVLYVGIASANRDPRRWGDDADAVVIDRPDANQHVQSAPAPTPASGRTWRGSRPNT